MFYICVIYFYYIKFWINVGRGYDCCPCKKSSPLYDRKTCNKAGGGITEAMLANRDIADLPQAEPDDIKRFLFRGGTPQGLSAIFGAKEAIYIERCL